MAAQTETLKAKFQVGTIHGKNTFSREEHVFHSEDIPKKGQEARKLIRELKKPDLLGRKPPKWNSSTQTGIWICHKGLPHEISRGGCTKEEPKHYLQPKWNVSSFVEYKEREKQVKECTSKSLAATAQKRILKGYRPPHIREKEFMEKCRKVKEACSTFVSNPAEGVNITRKLAVNSAPSNLENLDRPPSPTFEALAAVANVVSKQLEDDPLHVIPQSLMTKRALYATLTSGTFETLRPKAIPRRDPNKQTLGHDTINSIVSQSNSMSVSKHSLRKKVTYKHTGVWQYLELEGMEVWTCCLATKMDARGCTRVIRNLDSLNLEGP